MSIQLNRSAVSHARSLIKSGKVDKEGSWSAPDSSKEDSYIQKNGIGAFGKWFLGIHTEHPADEKGHYGYPIGNFETISRRGVISAKSRAAQSGAKAIETAADNLLKLIDGPKESNASITKEDFYGLDIKVKF